MTEQRNIKFATDLVTFYDPAFWGEAGGMDTLRNLLTSSEWNPARFWERILDSARAALAGDDLAPRRLDAAAERRQHAQTGDNNAPH